MHALMLATVYSPDAGSRCSAPGSGGLTAGFEAGSIYHYCHKRQAVAAVVMRLCSHFDCLLADLIRVVVVQDAADQMADSLCNEQTVARLQGGPQASLQTLAAVLALSTSQQPSALQAANPQEAFEAGTKDALRHVAAVCRVMGAALANGKGTFHPTLLAFACRSTGRVHISMCPWTQQVLVLCWAGLCWAVLCWAVQCWAVLC